nr:ATP synthase F0 subunit 8 [Aequorea sp. MKL-2023]
MSQLDISIFYNHLLGLLITLYVFAHFAVVMISTYYYNCKLRNLEESSESLLTSKVNKVDTLLKILE